MVGTHRKHRSYGVASGLLLALLGLWGALIPFIGPYFHYAYTPDTTWTYNTARLWLEILPGAATFLSGILLIATAGRILGIFSTLLGAAAGAWFALGTVFSPVWNHSVPLGGTPTAATTTMRVAEQIGFFTGLGIVIVFFAALALGRFLSVPAVVAEPANTVPVEPEPTQPVST
jgi:hypothetical protein